MTVSGAVAASELGTVLPHEHLFSNTLREYRSTGLLDDETVALNALLAFREGGGGTVVDVTPAELGRRPEALRRLSEESGVHIVIGCGHYRDPYLDRAYFDGHRTVDIAERIIREVHEGVDGTGVRPGVIGEIGAELPVVSAIEERSLRAAGIAQRETGLAVSLHAARSAVGRDMIRILDEERVPRERVILGHLDTVRDPDYLSEMAGSGVMLEFDGFCSTNEYETARDIGTLLSLVEQGHESRLLVSHDAFLTSHFAEFGGEGLTRIGRRIVPRLLEAGMSDEQIRGITELNPQRVLAIG